VSKRHRVISIPMWADMIGLADDGMSIAAARKLVADDDGPGTVPVRRRTRCDTGIRLRDHRRWVRSHPWAKYLAATALAQGRKQRTKK
jgi:hypothetical protein